MNGLKTRLKAWAQLLRVANLLTVPGDAIAGFWLTAGAGTPGRALAAAIAVGVLLYAAGLALNDFCDRKVDAEERPARPIPSGRIAPRAALAAAGALGAIAWLLAGTLLPGRALAVTASLSALIVLYNVYAKRYAWFGIPVMALCRGGSFLLGWSAAASGTPHWGACTLLMFYIALVSIVAAREANPGKLFPLSYLPGLGLGIAAAYWRQVPWFNILALVLALRTLLLGASLGQWPKPEAVQKTIGQWLVALPFLQGTLLLLAPHAPPVWIACVMALAIPARLIGKVCHVS